MPLHYQAHWRCFACTRDERGSPADRMHIDSVDPVCCFCGESTRDLARVAVQVVPSPAGLPLFPDQRTESPPRLHVLSGGKGRSR